MFYHERSLGLVYTDDAYATVNQPKFTLAELGRVSGSNWKVPWWRQIIITFLCAQVKAEEGFGGPKSLARGHSLRSHSAKNMALVHPLRINLTPPPRLAMLEASLRDKNARSWTPAYTVPVLPGCIPCSQKSSSTIYDD